MPRSAWDCTAISKSIYVIGDTIYDYWAEVRPIKIAPDAPAPVWETVGDPIYAPGGAANAARQLRWLNADVTLGTVYDECERLSIDGGHQLRILSQRGGVSSKMRYLSAGHILARLDESRGSQRRTPPHLRHNATDRVLDGIEDDLSRRDCNQPTAALLSDYAQGFWTSDAARRAVEMFTARGIPVVVDPKPTGVPIGSWVGAQVVKLNESEASAFTREAPMGDEFAARWLSRQLRDACIVITRGSRPPIVYGGPTLADGATLEIDSTHLTRSQIDRPVWSSGAGDCFAAYLAASLACSASLGSAVALAHAAGVAYVAKSHNQPVHPHEAREIAGRADARVYSSVDELSARLAALPTQTRVGYTNGVFDLFHPGHAATLAYAKTCCDFLVVAINTDESAMRRKGVRPVMNTAERLATVAACRSTDAAIAFDEPTPHTLYHALGPCECLIKGADWLGQTVVGASLARRVLYAPIDYPHHSTDIRARLAGRQGEVA